MSLFKNEIETPLGTLLVIGCETTNGKYGVNVSLIPKGSDYCLDITDVYVSKEHASEVTAHVYGDPESDSPTEKVVIKNKDIVAAFKKEGYYGSPAQ